MGPMPRDEVQRIAGEIFAWRESRTDRRPFDGLSPADLGAAYDVQEVLHGLLAGSGAGEIVGYKIALTSPTMQQMVSVDTPLAGALFSSLVHSSPASLDPGGYLRLGLECEVAVRLAEDLPATRAPYTREQIAERVDACASAFELVEDGNADYERIDASSLVADNCWNAGVVLGDWVSGVPARWLDSAFADARTVLEINGETAGEGRVRDAMGHPLEAVAWVANLLAGRGRSMARGMVVMTGSSVRTVFPDNGDHARFRIEDLGEVELSLQV